MSARGRLTGAVLVAAALLALAGATARAQEAPPATPPPAPDLPAALPARPALSPPRPGLPAISPTRAVLMTPLMPGWGQLYARCSWRSALAFGAETFYWSQLLKNDRKAVRYRTMGATVAPDLVDLSAYYTARTTEYRERTRDFAWWSLGALLIIALDAYVDANLYGFDQDPVPVPDHWDDPVGAAAAAVLQDADFAVALWRITF